MLGVIDYGASNLRSVLHALRHLGIKDMQIITEAGALRSARRLILPGQGAFGAGMQQLHRQGLVEPLKAAINAGVPYFGICLGMQFLFEGSDEMGQHEGLGLLPGKVTRFPDDLGLKIPHMGWNQLLVERESAMLKDLEAGSYAYFVHSYYCVPQNPDDLLLSADYGFKFAAGVQRDNLFAVQFHPEKSQSTGLRLLRNFLTLTEATA